MDLSGWAYMLPAEKSPPLPSPPLYLHFFTRDRILKPSFTVDQPDKPGPTIDRKLIGPSAYTSTSPSLLRLIVATM